MKPIFCFLLFIIVMEPMAAYGQSVPVGEHDSQEDVAWRYLRLVQGINSRADLKEKSIKNLEKLGKLPIKFQRVEVDGVGAIDNTSDRYPGMFDKQLKMSYMNEPAVSGKVRQTVHNIWNSVQDVGSAIFDMGGEPTAHAKEVLSEIHGKQVNELIAHSWGTEAVYAAILSGFIPPPKKLILVGIPERNEDQWRMLAKYTGIEVHVVGFSTDKVQESGNTVNYFATGLPRDPDALAKLWEQRCAERKGAGCADPNRFDTRKFDYNVNIKPPLGKGVATDELLSRLIAFGSLNQDKIRLSQYLAHVAAPYIEDALIYRLPPALQSVVMDHDRMLYYQYLAKRHLFNKTVAQLDAPQQKLIKDSEESYLSEAMGQAQWLISEARADLAARAAHDAAVRRASDLRLATAMGDIAIRACEDPDSIEQAELDALPHPADLADFSFLRPERFGLTSECAKSLFYDMRWRLGKGMRLTKAEIPDMIESAKPAQAVPTPPVATKNYRVHEILVKILAISACDGEDLPSEGLHSVRYLAAAVGRHPWVIQELNDPDSVSQEHLSGCSKTVYDQLVQDIVHNGFSASSDENMTNWIYAYALKAQPAPPPSVRSDPDPEPRSHAQSQRHCVASRGGSCVWWID